MMKEEGRVLALEGSYAIVVGTRSGACGACHAKGSCSALSTAKTDQEVRIRATNAIGAQPGDRVIVEIAEKEFLRASFVIYIIPLLVMALCGWAAYTLAGTMGFPAQAEGASGVACLLSLGISYGGLRWYNRYLEATSRFQPAIAEIF